ncbi:MAG: hypothetical protein K6U08_07165 [Firmicutes bacterium]|nr:hypothetical protein [Bacillota bacterium]
MAEHGSEWGPGIPGAPPGLLRFRVGTNPNSSGHGILWGAMFFVPVSVLGLITAGLVSGRLDEVLKRYREEAVGPPARGPAGGAALVVGLWTAAWAGFGAAWAVLLTTVTTLGQGSLGIAFGVVLALLTVAPVVAALLPLRHDPVVGLLTRRAALLALVPVAIAGLLWLVGRQPLMVGAGLPFFWVAWLYLAPLALALAAGALRLGSPRASAATLLKAGAVYVVGGLLFLIPVIPLGGGYNPVGVLFPFWGIGAPVLVAVRGLRRWSAGRSATSGPSGPDAGGSREGGPTDA